jgi:hypothetical protein
MIVPSHRCGDCSLASVVDRIIAGMLAAKLGQLDGREGVGAEKVGDEAATNGSAISSPPHHLFDRLRRLEPFRFKSL